MPPTADIQNERQQAIRDRLATDPVPTQSALVAWLGERGFTATQSSVSRDLREIGAIKTAAGYALPAADEDAETLASVAGLLRSVRPAGANLLVLGTAIGGAQRVALALDRSGWPELVGCIGGDDTIFVATENARRQKALAARIHAAMAR